MIIAPCWLHGEIWMHWSTSADSNYTRASQWRCTRRTRVKTGALVALFTTGQRVKWKVPSLILFWIFCRVSISGRPFWFLLLFTRIPSFSFICCYIFFFFLFCFFFIITFLSVAIRSVCLLAYRKIDNDWPNLRSMTATNIAVCVDNV